MLDPKLTITPDHKYFYDGNRIPGVSELLKSGGLIEDRFFTEEATERGHAVHLACHLYDIDDLDMDSVSSKYMPYLQAYIQFTMDTDFMVLHSELTLDTRNHTMAGTMDKVGMLDNRIILDVKTGGYAKWWEVQLTAYAMIYSSQFPDKGHLERRSLRLKENGGYSLSAAYDTDFDVVYGLIALWKWKYRNGLIK